MNEEDIIGMLSKIIEEVDYDIWKGAYNKETAECPEEVEGNYAILVEIVNEYQKNMGNVLMKIKHCQICKGTGIEVRYILKGKIIDAYKYIEMDGSMDLPMGTDITELDCETCDATGHIERVAAKEEHLCKRCGDLLREYCDVAKGYPLCECSKGETLTHKTLSNFKKERDEMSDEDKEYVAVPKEWGCHAPSEGFKCDGPCVMMTTDDWMKKCVRLVLSEDANRDWCETVQSSSDEK